MKAGDKVRIFEDPITCKHFEGRAMLHEKADCFAESTNEKEYWWVIFEDEDGFFRRESCGRFLRWVNKDKH